MTHRPQCLNSLSLEAPEQIVYVLTLICRTGSRFQSGVSQPGLGPQAQRLAGYGGGRIGSQNDLEKGTPKHGVGLNGPGGLGGTLLVKNGVS